MNAKYLRGSEWIKCDLHLHTPDTIKNDGFKSRNSVWEEYMEMLEISDVALFGITDYYSFENYFKLKKLYFEKYPKTNKIFLPNLELNVDTASNNRDEGYDVHLVFDSNLTECTLKNFLSNLKLGNTGESGKTLKVPDVDKSFIRTKAFTKINFIEDALKETFGESKPFLSFYMLHGKGGLQPEKGNGIKYNIAEEIDKRFVDVFFGSDSGDRLFGLGKRGGFFKPKAVLTGSDSHSFEHISDRLGKEFSNNGRKKFPTWIKVEPSFDGLKYLTYEPEDRVFIGTKPEVIDRVHQSKPKYISKVEIGQAEGYDENQGRWFKNEHIYPSYELTAIIGNKGKGKSAITDIIGLLGNSHNEKYFSFLDIEEKKFRKNGLASNFKAKLTWESGDLEEKRLDEHIDANAEERVKYLPQSYFEDLCNEIDDNENFIRELNQVVFKHIEETDRLGKDSFEDFLEEIKSNCESSIEALRGDLNDINYDIVNLLRKNTDEHKKNIESKIKNLNDDLNSHLKNKPKHPYPVDEEQNEENNDTDENYKKLKKEEEKLENAKTNKSKYLDELETVNENLIDLEQIKFRFEEEQKRINSFRKSEIEYLEKYNLKIDEIFPNPTFNLFTIQQKIDLLKKDKLKCQLELGKIEFTQDHTDIVKNRENLLWIKTDRIQKKYKELSNLLNEKQKRVEEYNTSLKDWNLRKLSIEGDEENPRPRTLKYYEKELTNIDNYYPKKLKEYKTIRNKITSSIYDKKREIVDIYTRLKRNIDSEIDKNEEKIKGYRISLEASFQVRGLKINFLDYIDKGKTGHFYGNNEAHKRFDEFIKELDPNDKETFLIKLDEITEYLEYSGGKKQNPFSQIRSSKELQDLFDYLYGLEFLNEKYDLKFAGKDIQQLSPGERGAALVVFYLLLDKDEKPLIIDQPEDNLDNQSVFEILVPFIKQAKKYRQLIIVTHNPNLAVVADAEQIIHVDIDKENNYRFSTVQNGIENEKINEKIVNVLEGTMPAFEKRKIKYLKNKNQTLS